MHFIAFSLYVSRFVRKKILSIQYVNYCFSKLDRIIIAKAAMRRFDEPLANALQLAHITQDDKIFAYVKLFAHMFVRIFEYITLIVDYFLCS